MLPDYTKGAGFYDPNAGYQSGSGTFKFPQAMQNVYGTNESPEGYYFGEISKRGLGGIDARSRAAQALFPRFQRGYEAAVLNDNANLMFPEFFQQSQLDRMMKQMTYEQLGLDPSRYGQGDRWGMRGG